MEFLKRWKIVLAILMIAASLILVAPRIGPSGWETNLVKGFDIAGGVRAILTPESTDSQMIQDTVAILQQRLNIYGLKDIKVSPISDLTGKKYILVEAAGMGKEEMRSLVEKQGRFEAKIGNATIFTGSDIMVDTYNNKCCTKVDDVYTYDIALRIVNLDASRKFAEETNKLSVSFAGFGTANSYLNETLDLYLDGKSVSSLQISADLKGKVFDTPQISGAAETKDDARKEMKEMQALLQSGSLPMSLTLSSVEEVSAGVGGTILSNVVMAGFAAIAAVGVVILLRYRSLAITGLIMSTVFAEALLVLGFSVLFNRFGIGWQFDISAIAGIIVSLGTGVNQEIIMVDEYFFYGRDKRRLSFKDKVKEATFIIFAAFGSGLGALLPLVFVNLGAVKGFAITTLIGMASGVIVSRPAFLDALDIIVSGKEKPASGANQ